MSMFLKRGNGNGKQPKSLAQRMKEALANTLGYTRQTGGAIRESVFGYFGGVKQAWRDWRNDVIPSTQRDLDGSQILTRDSTMQPYRHEVTQESLPYTFEITQEVIGILKANRLTRMITGRSMQSAIQDTFRLDLAMSYRSSIPMRLYTISPDSSYILKMYWTPQREQMRVDFFKRDRGRLWAVYEYFGVKEKDWDALRRSPDKGKHFYHHLRLTKPYILVYHCKPSKAKTWNPIKNNWGFDV